MCVKCIFRLERMPMWWRALWAHLPLWLAFVREDAAERVSDMIYAAGEFILYF
jgi:hypothetical protein